jgi:putative Mn2+ efflux pump MntP
MSYIEIILLAISLCFDTLAVSIVQGSCNRNMTLGQRLSIESTFGIVQGLFIFIGWLMGSAFQGFIDHYDHWVAFVLLVLIGGKMIMEYFEKKDEKECVNLLDLGPRVIAAIATSIDALAVGISMAMIDGFGWTKIIVTFIIVTFFTAAAAVLGLRGGKLAAKILGKKSSLIGGVVLIAIGVKILLEHLLA